MNWLIIGQFIMSGGIVAGIVALVRLRPDIRRTNSESSTYDATARSTDATTAQTYQTLGERLVKQYAEENARLEARIEKLEADESTNRELLNSALNYIEQLIDEWPPATKPPPLPVELRRRHRQRREDWDAER